MLITIFLGPKFIELLRVAGVRPADPRGGPAGAPRQGGHADDGRADPVRRDRGPVPGARSARHRRASRSSGSRSGAAALGFADDFIKVTKRRSLGLSARWKLLGPDRARASRSGGSRPTRSGLDPRLRGRGSSTPQIYLGPVLYVLFVFLVIAGASNAVNLTDGLDGLAAGSCAIVLLAYMAITITSGQEGLALLSGMLRRRLGRLPLVQRVPGVDLHGRHRLAGPGRRRSARSR